MTPTQVFGLLFFAFVAFSTYLDVLRWFVVKLTVILVRPRAN